MRQFIKITILVFAIALIAGCTKDDNTNNGGSSQSADDPLSTYEIPIPTAPGVNVESNDIALIDYSNIEHGYVIAKYSGSTDKALRVAVRTPHDDIYIYTIKDDNHPEIIPLTEGDGTYTIGIYEHIEGETYSRVISVTTDVTMIDEFLPFLHPNQFVSFTKESDLVALAADLTKNAHTIDEKITVLYDYVVKNFTYDYELAANVKRGYIPDLDEVLQRKHGICFDYSALVTAMLRSQGIPTRLEIGYHGEEYHAWISKLCDVEGWVENRFHHDGNEWYRMDPTLESGARRSHRSRFDARADDTYVLMFNY